MSIPTDRGGGRRPRRVHLPTGLSHPHAPCPRPRLLGLKWICLPADASDTLTKESEVVVWRKPRKAAIAQAAPRSRTETKEISPKDAIKNRRRRRGPDRGAPGSPAAPSRPRPPVPSQNRPRPLERLPLALPGQGAPPAQAARPTRQP